LSLHILRPLRRSLRSSARGASLRGRLVTGLLPVSLLVGATPAVRAQPADLPDPVPDRAEGEGPYERLVLCGAIVVDGAGAPPFGPTDIAIEGNRIVEIRPVGSPGAEMPDEERPAAGARELDVSGMYVLPGFVDLHGHQHTESSEQGVPATYVHKLWMAHGITTVADVGNFDVDWLMHHKARSAKSEITAPRVFAPATSTTSTVSATSRRWSCSSRPASTRSRSSARRP